MAFSRHITRNFNANKTHRIRYDEDDFTCQIFRYDKTYEKHYTPHNNTITEVANGENGVWNGMYCYRSTNEKQMTIRLKYEAKETSTNYRLELLFANTHRQTKTSQIKDTLQANATIRINGETVNSNMMMVN